MDRNTKKRKVSQDIHDKEACTIKYRGIQCQSGMNRRGTVQNSGLTERIVSLWKSGSGSGSAASATEKVIAIKDVMRLQDSEIKYKEADEIIQSMKRKLVVYEENVAGLNILLEKETTEKRSLLNKMSATWELIANISQHINSVTQILDRFQVQIAELSDKYDNVISKLRSENIVLETEMEQMIHVRRAAEEIRRELGDKEVEFNNLKVKYEILEDHVSHENSKTQRMINELETGKKKLLEMETMEQKLKILTKELENNLAAERNKLEQLNATGDRKLDEMRQNYESKMFELQKNFDKTNEQLQEAEENRNTMLNDLEEKKSMIANQKKEINLYQEQLRELMCQLTDTGIDFQRIKGEKTDLEMRCETKDAEITRLQKELETRTTENDALTKDKEGLNDDLEKTVRECMDVSTELTRCRIQLQETKKLHHDMTRNLQRDSDQKSCEIQRLQMQVQVLKRNSDLVLIEKSPDSQNRNKQLDTQHGHEITFRTEKNKESCGELDEQLDTMKDMRQKDSSFDCALSDVIMEEELDDLYCKEKEEPRFKLPKSENLLSPRMSEGKEIDNTKTMFQTNLTSINKLINLEMTKNNRILTLEKQLSNFGLSCGTQQSQTFQSQMNIAENMNRRTRNEEMTGSGKIKSILKPHVTSHPPSSSPKPLSKKISFNFGSDSSDDFFDSNHQNISLSCNAKFDHLKKKESYPTSTQSSASQTSTAATPLKSKKFFKSRGNS